MNEIDEERAPSAADALAIIERERARTGAGLMPNLTILYGAWGLAWTVSGIAFFGYLTGTVTGLAAALVGITLGVLATVASIVTAIRSGRGVRTASDLQGALYGFSWTISMVAMGVLVGVSADSMPEQLRGTLIPALFVFVAGVLYLAGGAVWSDRLQYAVGVWTIVVAVVSLVAGTPANALVLGGGGGGGFLAVAAWYAYSARRA